MLELTFASKSKARNTAKAVVVPAGILSPITKQSVKDAIFLPTILPY